MLTSLYVRENTLGSLRSNISDTWSNSGDDIDGIPPQKQYACMSAIFYPSLVKSQLLLKFGLQFSPNSSDC